VIRALPPRHLLALLVACCAVLTSCSLAWKRYGPGAIEQAQGHVVDAGVYAERIASSQAKRAAVREGHQLTQRALAAVQADPAALALRALRATVDAEAWERAETLLPFVVFDDPAEARRLHALVALERGQLDAARAFAWEGFDADPDARPTFLQWVYDSLERDPHIFSPEPYTLEPGVDLDRLVRQGGGSTITLRMNRDGETFAAFKPWQSRYQTNYRAEIAAYRLCFLIRCGFSIPHNREVRLREADAGRLFGVRPITNATGFGDLLFFTDDDGTRWLYATEKEWVPGFTKFPIETTSAWEHLVSRSMTRERLEAMDLPTALARIRSETDKYTAIMERAEGLTALDLARQLSNLHVFDLLINNWDRYSGAYPGVNCQFNHGMFVSIDNGAAFQARRQGNTSEFTTWNRLRRIEIFSRSTIDSIRAMDTDRARALLFPTSRWHTDDDDRWERFLHRRERLLSHIDALIEQHGEDRVLVLP
jgi:hypothetical protein